MLRQTGLFLVEARSVSYFQLVKLWGRDLLDSWEIMNLKEISINKMKCLEFIQDALQTHTYVSISLNFILYRLCIKYNRYSPDNLPLSVSIHTKSHQPPFNGMYICFVTNPPILLILPATILNTKSVHSFLQIQPRY